MNIYKLSIGKLLNRECITITSTNVPFADTNTTYKYTTRHMRELDTKGLTTLFMFALIVISLYMTILVY